MATIDFNALVLRIENIQTELQRRAASSVNTSLTIRNWLIGCYIVEYEQNGKDRAKYGAQLLKNLELKLNNKGLTERRFREFRRFYTIYPQLESEILRILPSAPSIQRLPTAESDSAIRHSISAELQNVKNQENWLLPAEKILYKISYTHLKKIIYFDNPIQRAFYELETIKGCWSVAELERQINTLYYERSGLSKNKKALSDLVNLKSVELMPKDIINTPITLEFLGLNERALVTETDLEEAILNNLQHFLLEMGYGFCFEARQKRILIDDDYFFADLVFYHRILKCHVIVELKVDKFRHEFASQLNMYLNYFKNEMMAKDDNLPIGILLCAKKGEMQVKYATAGLDETIFVQKYLVQLPSESELLKYISKEIKIQS